MIIPDFIAIGARPLNACSGTLTAALDLCRGEFNGLTNPIYPEASDKFVLMLAHKMQMDVECDELRQQIERKDSVVTLMRRCK